MGTSLFKMPFDIEKTKVTPIYRNPVLDQAEVETITCDQIPEAARGSSIYIHISGNFY